MDHSKMLAKSLTTARIENKDLHLAVQRPNRALLADSTRQLFDFGQSILRPTESRIKFLQATTRQSCLVSTFPLRSQGKYAIFP